MSDNDKIPFAKSVMARLVSSFDALLEGIELRRAENTYNAHEDAYTMRLQLSRAPSVGRGGVHIKFSDEEGNPFPDRLEDFKRAFFDVKPVRDARNDDALHDLGLWQAAVKLDQPLTRDKFVEARKSIAHANLALITFDDARTIYTFTHDSDHTGKMDEYLKHGVCRSPDLEQILNHTLPIGHRGLQVYVTRNRLSRSFLVRHDSRV